MDDPRQEAIDKAMEEAKAACDHAYEVTPDAYKQFITLIRQAKRVGGNQQNPWLAYIHLPYMRVDGRVKMAEDEHGKRGETYNVGTRFFELNGDRWMCEATVHSGIRGMRTGHSQVVLIEGKGADKTNPFENAETSAIGRALGFMGYGIFGGGIASAEEVASAVDRQEGPAREEPVPEPDPDDIPEPRLKLDTLESIDDAIREALIRQGVIPEDVDALIDRTLGDITRDHAQVAIDLSRWSRLSALWFNKYAAILRERAGISQEKYRQYMAKNFPDVHGAAKLNKKQQQQTINWLSVVAEDLRDIGYAHAIDMVHAKTGLAAEDIKGWLLYAFGMDAASDESLIQMTTQTLADTDDDMLREDIEAHATEGT